MEPPPKKQRPEVPLFGAPGGSSPKKPDVPLFAASSGTSPKKLEVPAFAATSGASPEKADVAGSEKIEQRNTAAANSEQRNVAAAKIEQRNSTIAESGKQHNNAEAHSEKAEQRNNAEAERRRKAGLSTGDPKQDQSTPAPKNASSGPTPRAPDVVGVDPAALHAALAVEPNLSSEKSSVYGFVSPKASESGASKAIALRMEPLKASMPSFERVLSETKQSIVIGSQRGVVDVLVSDEVVSKKHTTIALVGIKGELALSIVDTSTNGTYVNGEKLHTKHKKYRLRNGDKLQLMDPSVDEEFGWKVDFGNTVAYFAR